MQDAILKFFSKGGANTNAAGTKLQLPSPIRTGRAGLPSAVAFVDYEHWYISLNNNYGIRPNIKSWFEDLQKRVNVKEVMFFADFSHKSFSDEIGRIRPFTNKIIDTRSPLGGNKKDFTDFILLDNIYQKALMTEDTKAFILFSGDGHFSSVTSFLKNIYGKEVGIYAIKGCFSRQLQETSTWYVSLPEESDVYGLYYQKILEYLKDEENKKSRELPTFAKTAEEIAKDRRLDKRKALTALDNLAGDGIISKRSIRGRGYNAENTDAIFVNWEKAAEKGFI